MTSRSPEEYWIGLWREIDAGSTDAANISVRRQHWVWVDDNTPLTLDVQEWGRDKPTRGERCGMLDSRKGWSGSNCKNTKKFTCEKGDITLLQKGHSLTVLKR